MFLKLLLGIGLKYEKFWIGLYYSVCYTTTTVRLVHYLKDMDCAYSQIFQRLLRQFKNLRFFNLTLGILKLFLLFSDELGF